MELTTDPAKESLLMSKDSESTEGQGECSISMDSDAAAEPCTMSSSQEAEVDPALEVVIADDTKSVASLIQGDMCRICHCFTDDREALISPCACNGSMKFVHQACLQKWVKSRDARKCELCGTSYNMTSSVKPFRQWKKLDMSSVERRKVLCSVTFHVVAITCVIWSLYVLIDRTTQEIKVGNLNWPFWTKLVVVAIGFTGGLVFMYVQCKMYVQLFKKWKQFNRVIYIKNVNEGSDISEVPSSDRKVDDSDHLSNSNGRIIPCV